MPTLCRLGRGPEARDYFVICGGESRLTFSTLGAVGVMALHLRMHVAVVHVGEGENR